MGKKIFFVITMACFFVLIFNVFSYSISYNLNVKNSFFKTLSGNFVPQGWGFFTKDVRNDYKIDIFDESGKKLMYKGSHPNYLFGFSKKGRKIHLEVSIINGKIADTLWSDRKIKKWIKIDNKNLYYLKNGRYVLIRYKTPPYLWRNLPNIPKKQKVYVETGSFKN